MPLSTKVFASTKRYMKLQMMNLLISIVNIETFHTTTKYLSQEKSTKENISFNNVLVTAQDKCKNTSHA